MRNYISTRMLQVNLHGDDGMGGSIDVPAAACGADDDDLWNRLQTAIHVAEETNDPTHIYTWTVTYPDPITTVYWQFDKANVVEFADAFSQLFWLAIVQIGNLPYFGLAKAKLGTDYSPRQGWTDDAGVKRKPTPSDSGKSGESGASGAVFNTIPLVQYLSEIYGILVVKPNPDAKLKRLLADLLTAIKLAGDGTITQVQIDKIFAELASFGL